MHDLWRMLLKKELSWYF